MARFVSGIFGTGAGSATLPIFSVYGIAGVGFSFCEAACFNTTATAARERLQKLASAGTQGAGQVEAKYDDDSAAADCTAFTTHSSTGPTLGDGLQQMPMGAAIGSGTVIAVYDRRIEIAPGTANGIGIIPQGTGQIADVHMVWDE